MLSRGELTPDGEHATLIFRRRYPHGIDQVWAAISTPEGLEGWLMAKVATIEGRVGGRIELVSGPPQYHSIGQVLAWDPPRLFEYEWNVAPVPEMPRGERAIFRFELTADGDGTALRVTYRRLTRSTATGFLPGLHAFLDRLEAQLAGQPLPDWQERFLARGAEYPQWRGHADHGGG
ncbi:MAG: SRPBCC family protein [Deltaproteobacteria bacterium]|jgi:uncharacterized protein YndB with AHSA1/START domain|nr:SRPBCC family protein [Deltaproteobacteria bacterium]